MMFTASAISVAFGLLLLALLLVEHIQKRNWPRISLVLFITMLASGIYCLAAGIYLAVDWNDPMAGKDITTIAHYVHHPKGWVIIAAVRVWPYVLIVAGAVSVFIGAGNFWLQHRAGSHK
jgi:hypothetical protein